MDIGGREAAAENFIDTTLLIVPKYKTSRRDFRAFPDGRPRKILN